MALGFFQTCKNEEWEKIQKRNRNTMTKRRMKECRNFIGVGIQNTGIRIVDPFNSHPTISPLNILLQELDQLQFGHPRWQERDELAARVRFVLDFMKEKQTRDCCGFLVPSKSYRCRNLSIEKERRNPMFQTLLHESKLQKSRLFENPLKILQSKHCVALFFYGTST